ncbi:unnamed protein product [Amoebophrya sp. A120]|nr:unnamed protein product [Amoebophrya sp. A120]|eukprot:GSA120T00011191001.1
MATARTSSSELASSLPAYLYRARVLRDYSDAEEGEHTLRLVPGEEIYVCEIDEESAWWGGFRTHNPAFCGWFPSPYVKKIPGSDAPTVPTPTEEKKDLLVVPSDGSSAAATSSGAPARKSAENKKNSVSSRTSASHPPKASARGSGRVSGNKNSESVAARSGSGRIDKPKSSPSAVRGEEEGDKQPLPSTPSRQAGKKNNRDSITNTTTPSIKEDKPQQGNCSTTANTTFPVLEAGTPPLPPTEEQEDVYPPSNQKPGAGAALGGGLCADDVERKQKQTLSKASGGMSSSPNCSTTVENNSTSCSGSTTDVSADKTSTGPSTTARIDIEQAGGGSSSSPPVLVGNSPSPQKPKASTRISTRGGSSILIPKLDMNKARASSTQSAVIEEEDTRPKKKLSRDHGKFIPAKRNSVSSTDGVGVAAGAQKTATSSSYNPPSRTENQGSSASSSSGVLKSARRVNYEPSRSTARDDNKPTEVEAGQGADAPPTSRSKPKARKRVSISSVFLEEDERKRTAKEKEQEQLQVKAEDAPDGSTTRSTSTSSSSSSSSNPPTVPPQKDHHQNLQQSQPNTARGGRRIESAFQDFFDQKAEKLNNDRKTREMTELKEEVEKLKKELKAKESTISTLQSDASNNKRLLQRRRENVFRYFDRKIEERFTMAQIEQIEKGEDVPIPATSRKKEEATNTAAAKLELQKEHDRTLSELSAARADVETLKLDVEDLKLHLDEEIQVRKKLEIDLGKKELQRNQLNSLLDESYRLWKEDNRERGKWVQKYFDRYVELEEMIISADTEEGQRRVVNIRPLLIEKRERRCRARGAEKDGLSTSSTHQVQRQRSAAIPTTTGTSSQVPLSARGVVAAPPPMSARTNPMLSARDRGTTGGMSARGNFAAERWGGPAGPMSNRGGGGQQPYQTPNLLSDSSFIDPAVAAVNTPGIMTSRRYLESPYSVTKNSKPPQRKPVEFQTPTCRINACNNYAENNSNFVDERSTPRPGGGGRNSAVKERVTLFLNQ